MLRGPLLRGFASEIFLRARFGRSFLRRAQRLFLLCTLLRRLLSRFLLSLECGSLRGFLLRTCDQVPPGAEPDFLDLDLKLAQLLA